MPEPMRCPWAGDDPLMIEYHDREWGVPEYSGRKLFELLLLEGAQAGLSWQTILRKREGYRRAFDDFDPGKIAHYGDDAVTRLLGDPEIVRNRLKVAAAIGNARYFLEAERGEGGFSGLIWDFVGGQPVDNRRTSHDEVPALSPQSEGMSRELRRRGFRFVGPTICYAFMQAAGLVNDHLTTCFRYNQVKGNS